MNEQLPLCNKMQQIPETSFWLLLCIFVINPFICFLVVIYKLGRGGRTISRNNAFFFISLFLGFVAYTQNTQSGDLARTYEDIVDSHYLLSYGLSFFLLQSKHVLYDIVNQLIYSTTGEVRLVTLFWIFLLFYCTLLAIDNISRLEKYKLNQKEFYVLVVSTLLCFILFTQITELMKQGVATALFLYALSLFLTGEKIKGSIVILAAINIHFSVFFLLPVLFVKRVPPVFLLSLLGISFFFRGFGLMEFLLTRLNSLPFIGDYFMMGDLIKSAESYQNQMDNFFRSDSPYFQFIFWSFFLVSLLTYFYSKKDFLIKICFAFLIILNFCFNDNHNYTRLLTMLFPFYIALYFVIKQMSNKQISSYLINVLLFCTFVANARIFIARITSSGYGTSYLDNSLLNLFLYPSFMYIL